MKPIAAFYVILAVGLGSSTLSPVRVAAEPEATRTHIETFSNYANKLMTENAVWDIWGRALRLDEVEDTPRSFSVVDVKGSPDGGQFAVWMDQYSQAGIFIKKVDGQGNNLWPLAVRIFANSSAGLDRQYQAMAVDAAGNAVIVWSEWVGGWDLYAQKLNPSGVKQWLPEVRITSASSDASPQAVLECDGDGNAIVAWSDRREGNADIYAQKLSPTGSRAWATELRINSDAGTADQTDPRLARVGGNDFVVSWTDGRGGDQDIYAQGLSASGTKRWPADVRVNSDTSAAAQTNHVLASDPLGNAILAWEDRRDTPDTPAIYAQKLDVNGAKLWGLDTRIAAEADSAQSTPRLAINSLGEASVVWRNNRAGSWDIVMRRLGTNGASLWPAAVRVNDATLTEEHKLVGFGVGSAGETVVMWHHYLWGAKSGYFLQHIAASGGKIWPEALYLDWLPVHAASLLARVDLEGRVKIAWYYPYDVSMQTVGADGAKQWARDSRVNDHAGIADQTLPSIALGPGGHIYAAWSDRRNARNDVYVQRIDVQGNGLWMEDTRISSSGASDGPIGVATNAAGHLVAAWRENRRQMASFDVQMLDGNGNRLWPASVQFNPTDGAADLAAMNPVVALDKDGSSYVVWSQESRPYGPYDIVAQRLDPGGNLMWPSSILVNSDDVDASHSAPQIVMDSDGSAVVVWFDRRNGNNDIYAQKLSQNGSRLWPADVRVNSVTQSAHQIMPAMAIDSGGNTTIVWSDFYRRINGQKLDRYGNKQWPGDGGDLLQGQSISVDPWGNAVVTWSKSIMTPAGVGRLDIYAQRLNANGARQWPDDLRINSDDSYTDQEKPRVVVDAGGTATVVWQDTRNGNYDVYAQRMNVAGVKLWPADLPVIYPDHFYYPTGIAESRTVDELPTTITRATLTADAEANGGDLRFSLSNDGGVTWNPVTLGVAHAFTTTGSDLRWKAALTADPVWGRTPMVHSMRIEYTDAQPSFDGYEPDDACTGARSIAVNGASQAHTFHQSADADWVRFEVSAGTTYVVQTAQAQANANTTLEVYGACAQAPFASDANAFGTDARVTFKAPETGVVYARVVNDPPAATGEQTGYDLAVRTFRDAAVAVIVAGRNDTYALQANISNAGDQAYRTLVAAGVPKANIRYFSTAPNHDVDGNGSLDDIYGSPSDKAIVADAVQNWARERGVRLGVPFFLYLVDHGGVDQFLANGSATRITPTDLDLWLSNLEALTGADQVNVIIEACLSGSFIDVTSTGPGSISHGDVVSGTTVVRRVVIASTSSGLNAYASTQGAQFSDVFWTAVGQNKDLKTAYDSARQSVLARGVLQEPWLDDTGDGIVDYRDGLLARGRGLGEGYASAPVIDWVRVGAESGTVGVVSAQVRDDGGIGRVHVEVYAPDFTAPAPSPDGTTPVLNVPTAMLQAAGGSSYRGEYGGFTQAGTYRVVVYAQDNQGNQAPPMTVMVQAPLETTLRPRNYLPIVTQSMVSH